MLSGNSACGITTAFSSGNMGSIVGSCSAVGKNADLSRELFSAFLDSLRPHLEELRALHRAADWPALCSKAHRLHGSAAYCGVPALKSAVNRLELAASASDTAAIGAGKEALEREIARLLLFTANHRDGNP